MIWTANQLIAYNINARLAPIWTQVGKNELNIACLQKKDITFILLYMFYACSYMFLFMYTLSCQTVEGKVGRLNSCFEKKTPVAFY